jgi:hypothetical protein
VSALAGACPAPAERRRRVLPGHRGQRHPPPRRRPSAPGARRTRRARPAPARAPRGRSAPPRARPHGAPPRTPGRARRRRSCGSHRAGCRPAARAATPRSCVGRRDPGPRTRRAAGPWRCGREVTGPGMRAKDRVHRLRRPADRQEHAGVRASPEPVQDELGGHRPDVAGLGEDQRSRGRFGPVGKTLHDAHARGFLRDRADNPKQACAGQPMTRPRASRSMAAPEFPPGVQP